MLDESNFNFEVGDDGEANKSIPNGMQKKSTIEEIH